MRVRRLPLVAAALAVLLLAGCASIPLAGPVQTAPAVVQQDDPGFVFTPSRPADGATPEAIVRGFVQAAIAGRGYHVAREFLTEGFASRWRPDRRVLVYTQQWTTRPTAGDRVRLVVTPTAVVDETGFSRPATQAESLDYALQRVRGQWRIADGPQGVVLAQTAFLRVFKPALLQYFDAGYQRFVPDRRWFPVRSNQRQDTIRALVAGQAQPLREVTRTAFPRGTALQSPVRVAAGQVVVDLTAPAPRPDRRATDRMQQQLAASLTPQGGTSTIRLTLNGVTAPAAPPPDLQQPSATVPVVVSGGRFGSLGVNGTVQEDRQLGPGVVRLEPRAVTVSASRRAAAVLTGDGRVAVVTTKGRPKVVDPRPGLVAPTMDQSGWIYSVPADDPTAVRVFDPTGRRADFQAALGGAGVTAIEASPDGTRLLVVTSGSGGEAYVEGIVRDAKGAPTGLTSDRYPVATSGEGVLAATWVDQSSVALLTAGASVQTVSQQQLGGISLALGPPLQGARRIVGATNVNDLRVKLRVGALYRRATNRWTLEFPASVRVDVLAVQR